MATYYARIELHKAKWPDDYEKLHASLQKLGFTNCVPSSDGKTYRLPTAFYYASELSDDIQKVANAVRKCADDSGYENEVVVVKREGAYFFLNSECRVSPAQTQ